MLKLAIFDLAGTTVHDESTVTHCLLDALKGAGYEVPFGEVNSRMGIPKPVAIAEVVPWAAPMEIARIHEDFRTRILDHYHNHPSVREIEGVTPLFVALRERGVKIGLDTGFDRETTDAILDRLDWRSRIDASAASDEVENGRPAPDLALKLMAELGVSDPNEVAKIGDTPSDLGEGTAAGCRWVVGVTYGSHRREELEGLPHTHMVDSVAELSTLLLSAAG